MSPSPSPPPVTYPAPSSPQSTSCGKAMETPPCSSVGRDPSLRSPSSVANLNPSSPYSVPRLWRPAAQRNLRNQWSNLLAYKDRWISAVSGGRSNATALVNAYLSRRYMPQMNLGILKGMPNIRQKASDKLDQKQELCGNKLLSSYKDMADVVSHLVKTSSSMRCFLKGLISSPIVQFCNYTDDKNDCGDGNGIPVFSSWSISYFETLAQELVEMFVLELSFKRLLVIELLSISRQETSRGKIDKLSWSHELYPGEFDALSMCDLLSKESHQPLPLRMKDWHCDKPLTQQSNHLPDSEVLQVYLTAWLADMNIDNSRVDEIFAMVEEEMQVRLVRLS